MSREMRATRLRFAAVALLALLSAGAALSSCSDRVTGPGDQNGAATVNLTNNLRFEPATITIKVGEAVTWKNTSTGIAHTVTADASKASNAADVELPAGAQPFDSGFIAAGGEYSHTFTVAGTYKYFCQPHETLGMLGTVVVTQ